MKRLIVTDEAKADLRNIERYSRRKWGSEQARDYRYLIIECVARLMENPRRGRRQERLAVGMRRINVRSHAIFYLDHESGIVISRIVHQRMDIGSALFAPKKSEGD
jgi:toxin ParE1/3/4